MPSSRPNLSKAEAERLPGRYTESFQSSRWTAVVGWCPAQSSDVAPYWLLGQPKLPTAGLGRDMRHLKHPRMYDDVSNDMWQITTFLRRE